MLKRSLLVVVVAAVAAAAPAGAAKPAAACPGPFAELTFAEALQLAQDTGVPGTPADHLAFLVRVDQNADEKLCFLDPPDTPGLPPSAFIVIDNTANVRR